MSSDSQAYSLLLSSYGRLVEAIKDATPGALLAENAIQRGITSQNAIKAIVEGAAAEQIKKDSVAA